MPITGSQILIAYLQSSNNLKPLRYSIYNYEEKGD